MDWAAIFGLVLGWRELTVLIMIAEQHELYLGKSALGEVFLGEARELAKSPADPEGDEGKDKQTYQKCGDLNCAEHFHAILSCEAHISRVQVDLGFTQAELRTVCSV
jgi:hypothetical protein